MGKGEGLNPSSKGSLAAGACLHCVKPGSIGQFWLPPYRVPAQSHASRGFVHTDMEETVVRPSVFVVDGQTDIPFTRLGRHRQKQPCSAARLGLGLLLLLAAGLAVQGWFLLRLHWRLGEIVAPLPVSRAQDSWRGGFSCVTVCLCVPVCAEQGRDSEQPRPSYCSFPICKMGIITRVPASQGIKQYRVWGAQWRLAQDKHSSS